MDTLSLVEWTVERAVIEDGGSLCPEGASRRSWAILSAARGILVGLSSSEASEKPQPLVCEQHRKKGKVSQKVCHQFWLIGSPLARGEDRREKGKFDWPAPSDAVINQDVGESSADRPLSEGEAVGFSWSTVARAFAGSNPSAIAWLIARCAVDTIKPSALRSSAHVGQEGIVAVTPAVTNGNATSTVVLVS